MPLVVANKIYYKIKLQNNLELRYRACLWKTFGPGSHDVVWNYWTEEILWQLKYSKKDANIKDHPQNSELHIIFAVYNLCVKKKNLVSMHFIFYMHFESSIHKKKNGYKILGGGFTKNWLHTNAKK